MASHAFRFLPKVHNPKHLYKLVAMPLHMSSRVLVNMGGLSHSNSLISSPISLGALIGAQSNAEGGSI